MMRSENVRAADVVGQAGWQQHLQEQGNYGRTIAMVGHLEGADGRVEYHGGFRPAGLKDPLPIGPPVPLGIQRTWGGGGGPTGNALSERNRELLERMQRVDIQRGETVGDFNQIARDLGTSVLELARGITSSMTAFPVRENLEAEAKILIPLETPVRNRLPRTPGAGTASQWRQATSLGGGWGTALDQPGGVSAIQSFFAETGAPAAFTTVYANVSKGYKLLGAFGSVTAFAMAAGANFMNQLATEKTNQLRNLMLNEENALINGDATSTAAPWGDGSNALAFDGLIPLTATGNGTPAAQVQTAVGPLTQSHIDNQIYRLWVQGARGLYIILNGIEMLSLVHLMIATGTIVRLNATMEGKAVLGAYVGAYVHPITGEQVELLASRFMPQGTIIFGSTYLPDGTPSADVNVLPQVQLPSLAPNEQIQGYTAQELAPTTAAPQVMPFIASVFEVLRMKSAKHFAKSTGVTAV